MGRDGKGGGCSAGHTAPHARELNNTRELNTESPDDNDAVAAVCVWHVKCTQQVRLLPPKARCALSPVPVASSSASTARHVTWLRQQRRAGRRGERKDEPSHTCKRLHVLQFMTTCPQHPQHRIPSAADPTHLMRPTMPKSMKPTRPSGSTSRLPACTSAGAIWRGLRVKRGGCSDGASSDADCPAERGRSHAPKSQRHRQNCEHSWTLRLAHTCLAAHPADHSRPQQATAGHSTHPHGRSRSPPHCQTRC